MWQMVSILDFEFWMLNVGCLICWGWLFPNGWLGSEGMPDWETISGLCPDDILPAAGRYHRFAVTISALLART